MQAATSFVCVLIGDTIAQLMGGAPYSLTRVLRLAAYSSTVGASTGHYWHRWLEANVHPEAPTSTHAVSLQDWLDLRVGVCKCWWEGAECAACFWAVWEQLLPAALPCLRVLVAHPSNSKVPGPLRSPGLNAPSVLHHTLHLLAPMLPTLRPCIHLHHCGPLGLRPNRLPRRRCWTSWC